MSDDRPPSAEEDFFGARPFRTDVLDGPNGNDAHEEVSLRPTTFDEFVGQSRITENLLIAIETARDRGESLDHVLLSGMPGLGKTTLATLIARAMDGELRTTSGPALEHGKDLLGVLTCLNNGDVLFIDEIHRMNAETEEYLYSAMEDYRVDIVVDRGPDARTYPININRFTLIGATTREGLLSAPFRSRFHIQEKLESYTAEELSSIVLRSASILNAEIEDEAAMELARRSRGTPRFANRFLRRVRDVAQYRRKHDQRPGASPEKSKTDARLMIDESAVQEGLERLGVDDSGLDRIDRRILQLLVESGERPTGIKTISVSVGEEARTIEEVYEPYLIRRGLLVKTPRGRLATARAAELVAALT